MTDDAGLYIGLRLRCVAARQPSRRVSLNRDQRLVLERGLGLRTTTPASGQQADAKRQQREPLQRSFSYP
jgi:hypothetical protein